MSFHRAANLDWLIPKQLRVFATRMMPLAEGWMDQREMTNRGQ
jgi:hypothetical protein